MENVSICGYMHRSMMQFRMSNAANCNRDGVENQLRDDRYREEPAFDVFSLISTLPIKTYLKAHECISDSADQCVDYSQIRLKRRSHIFYSDLNWHPLDTQYCMSLLSIPDCNKWRRKRWKHRGRREAWEVGEAGMKIRKVHEWVHSQPTKQEQCSKLIPHSSDIVQRV